MPRPTSAPQGGPSEILIRSLISELGLCLYTDGVTEACDAAGTELGHRRLADVLRHQSGSVLTAARATYRAVQAHKDTKLLDDDLTFLLVESAGEPTP